MRPGRGVGRTGTAGPGGRAHGPGGGGSVISYALSSPFDVSSRAPTGFLIVPASHGAISDVAVSRDGTVMLVTASARSTAGNGTVISYALPSPFDLSTVSQASSVHVPAVRGASVGAAFFGMDDKSALVTASRPGRLPAFARGRYPALCAAARPPAQMPPTPTPPPVILKPPPRPPPGAPRVCR